MFLLALLQSSLAADIREPLSELVAPVVEDDRIGALVVVVVADGEVRTLTYGSRKQEVDRDSVFEIGSVSKAFTGMLLADSVRRDELKLSDPLSTWIDGELPTYEGDGITLLDLATHTSGLPRLPDDFAPSKPNDPYAGATSDTLLASLRATSLDAKPGETYLYSNLGASVLGHVLEKASGKSYDTLLRERIVEPMKLTHTGVDTPQVIQGHDVDGVPVQPWALGAFAPTGGIHASPRDLARVIASHLRATGPLGESLALASKQHRSLGEQGSVGLFWHRTAGGTVWHNGQTGGFHALIAFTPSKDVGVVAVGDTATDLVDRIGFAALELVLGETPDPLPLRRTVDVPTSTLEPLAGEYGPARVSFVDGALWFELPDQPRHRMWAESPSTFHLRAAPVVLTFEGKRLVFEQSGLPHQEWRKRH